MNFSTIKKMTIPEMKNNEICIENPNSSTASGIKWINAPPIKAPAEKLTSNNKNFFNVLSLKARNNTPTNEIKLTIITLIIVWSHTIIIPQFLSRQGNGLSLLF